MALWRQGEQSDQEISKQLKSWAKRLFHFFFKLLKFLQLYLFKKIFYCYSSTVFCLFPHHSSPPCLPLLSGHCQPVPNFNIFGFTLLVHFVDYVPVKGEIIWYLSLTAWLISLSIMLSSSIHAVAKGRSSFFLLHRIPLCKYTIVFWSTHLLMSTCVASSTWLL